MNEKQVEQEIIHALEHLGFFVSKTSQPQKPVGMTRGLPDLYAAHEGEQFDCFVEVKSGRNEPSVYQQAWHKEVRAAGQTVLVCWSVDDLIDGLKDAGFPVED